MKVRASLTAAGASMINVNGKRKGWFVRGREIGHLMGKSRRLQRSLTTYLTMESEPGQCWHGACGGGRLKWPLIVAFCKRSGPLGHYSWKRGRSRSSLTRNPRRRKTEALSARADGADGLRKEKDQDI